MEVRGRGLGSKLTRCPGGATSKDWNCKAYLIRHDFSRDASFAAKVGDMRQSHALVRCLGTCMSGT